MGKRLAHPSAVVKSKCLRAIKFCCGQPGMQSLRSAVQPHLAGVRACLAHTGPPHALRGDAPHRIVRELAAEALRAAFGVSDEVPLLVAIMVRVAHGARAGLLVGVAVGDELKNASSGGVVGCGGS